MRMYYDGKYHYLGKWRGVVSRTDDPIKQGRIRVRVPGLYDDVESPWALPSMSPSELKLPVRGQMVWVEFERGDPSMLIWVGYVPSGETGDLPLPDLVRGVPDDSVKAPRGANQVTMGSGRVLNEAPSAYNASYGSNNGVTTPGGISIERDDTVGQERVGIFHPAGSSVEIVSDGGIRVRAAKYNELIRTDKITHVLGKELKAVEDVSEVLYKKGRKEDFEMDVERTYVGKLNETVGSAGIDRTIKGAVVENISGGVRRTIGGTKRETVAAGYQLGVSGQHEAIILQSSSEIIGNAALALWAKSILVVMGGIKINAIAGILQLNGLLVRLGGDLAFEPLVKGLSFMMLFNTHMHELVNPLAPTLTTPPTIPMIPGIHTSVKVLTE